MIHDVEEMKTELITKDSDIAELDQKVKDCERLIADLELEMKEFCKNKDGKLKKIQVNPIPNSCLNCLRVG